MALELSNLETQFGFPLSTAYAKVIFFAHDVQQQLIGIQVAYYADKAAADAKKPYLAVHQFQIGPTEQIIQQEVKHPVTHEVLVPQIALPKIADVLTGAGKTAFDSVKAISYGLLKTYVAELQTAKDV